MNNQEFILVDAIIKLKTLDTITVGEYNQLSQLLSTVTENNKSESSVSMVNCITTVLVPNFTTSNALFVLNLIDKYLSPKTREVSGSFLAYGGK